MSNWSTQSTSFIGRRRELTEISQLLTDPACGLLTLLGLGGVGKSRLALVAAERHAPHFGDNVFFAPLQGVPTADGLVSAIADALQITFRGQVEPQIQLLERLRERRMLLILDSLEHLLTGPGHDTTVDLLGDLVRTAPGVMLLVTSREVLHMQEEWVFPVRGLPYTRGADESASDAVALFGDRARRARVDFDLAREEPAVIRICQLTEGNPLALELSAAWTRSLSCAAIADEIERDLSFLASRQRDASARHASMQAVFDQSWARLTDEEQTVLQRLSVFQDGCTQDAAQEIAGATLLNLATLVDRSLLRHTRSGRYQLHELLRQYAAEQLDNDPDERERTYDRHTTYYLTLLHRLTPDVQGGRQIEAQKTFTADIHNLSAAWRRAVDQENAAALGRATEALVLLCDHGSRFYDGRDLFQFAVERFALRPDSKKSGEAPEAESGRTGERELVLAQMQTGLGMCFLRLGRMEDARALLEECIVNLRRVGADAHLALAFAIYWLAHVHLFQSRYQEARQAFLESLALYTELDNAWGIGGSSYMLGATAAYQGAFGEADRFLEMSERQLRPIGERRLLVFCMMHRALIARLRGEYARSEKLLLEGLAFRREMNDLWSIGYSTRELGYVATAQGDYSVAQMYLEECLAAFQETGAYASTIFALEGLGTVARLRSNLQEADRLYRQALTISEEIQELRGEARCRLNLGRLARDQEDYALAEEFLRASLDLYQEIGHQPGVGFTAGQLGTVIGMDIERRNEADRYFGQALDIGTEIDLPPLLLDVLLGWATARLANNPTTKKQDLGAALLALVSGHPASTHEMKQTAREYLAGLITQPTTYERFDLDAAVASVREELIALIGDAPGPASTQTTTEQSSLPDWLESLTPREIEVLALIEEGLSNRQIAERLVLTVGTVKWYASQIYSKLGAQNRSEAVYIAQQFDLLS